MSYNEFRIKRIDTFEKEIMEEVQYLLKQNDLTVDLFLEERIGIFDGKKLIATGGIKGNTLRCIAVDKAHQGGRVLNILIGELLNIQYHRNVNHIFLFTKPASKRSFEFLGFHVVEEVNNEVVLMENRQDGLASYLKGLSKHKVDGEKIGSIVINGNPFTLGHRYLIERAGRENDYLHIFVLSSDESSFPYRVRMQLIEEGTNDINNITIHGGGDYIISSATFPSYFIKEESNIVGLHAALDVNIFGKYIAPCLGINRRYVGEEPYCAVTREYNKTMEKILPRYGIELVEIPRKGFEGGYISASKVREAIGKDEIEKIKGLVPPSTYSFLISEEGEKVIKRVKAYSTKRH